jgi:hypothetical protein
MQFFTAQGMKEATGYGEPKDWYFVVKKELLDNAIDWLQDNYIGSDREKVTAIFMINKDSTGLNCKVRNSNPKNILVEAFNQLHNILDYDKTFGSKQNEFRGIRGQLGDGLKRLIGLPFILMNMGDDQSAFFKKQWQTPMYFRANGIERQATVKVNLGASQAINNIAVSSQKLPHTDTEVEITLPIIDEVKDSVTVSRLEKFCRLSVAAVADINFHIEIIKEEERAVVIDLEAKHPIIKNKVHKTSSIETYRPAEFVNRIESFFDREHITLYQVIRKFTEGAQMPKSAFNRLLEVEDVEKLSLADFMSRPDYQEKMLVLYNLLMEEENK